MPRRGEIHGSASSRVPDPSSLAPRRPADQQGDARRQEGAPPRRSSTTRLGDRRRAFREASRSRCARPAVKSVTPVLETRSRRVGGGQLPGARRGSRHAGRRNARDPLARRSPPAPDRDRARRAMAAKLAGELLMRSSSRAERSVAGRPLPMAQANKAFAHYSVTVADARHQCPCGLEKTSQHRIMAHIDAGKTTRPSGSSITPARIHKTGEVHEGAGDDGLDRRSRSVASRSRRLPRRVLARFPHQHLIGTPGHVDFTVEVERSLPCSTERSPSSTASPVSSRSPRRSGVRPPVSVPRSPSSTDGPHRSGLLRLRAVHGRQARRPPGARAASDRPGGALPRRRRPRRDARDHLQRRPRHQHGDRRDPGRADGAGERVPPPADRLGRRPRRAADGDLPRGRVRRDPRDAAPPLRAATLDITVTPVLLGSLQEQGVQPLPTPSSLPPAARRPAVHASTRAPSTSFPAGPPWTSRSRRWPSRSCPTPTSGS